MLVSRYKLRYEANGLRPVCDVYSNDVDAARGCYDLIHRTFPTDALRIRLTRKGKTVFAFDRA